MAAAVGDNMDLSGRAFMQDPSAPDPVRPHAGNNASRDAFNDPYNYDAQIDDVFRDANETNHTANSTGRNDEREVDLFKEVQQDRKPRAKQAKLDEQRLLSPKGIPALRKISKERLKFRGKGHEVCLGWNDLLTSSILKQSVVFRRCQVTEQLSAVAR